MKVQQIIIFFLAILATNGNAQTFDNPVLQQWTNKDAKYNDPQNGNPVLPGYFADPSIIEDKGIFYIYATSDLKSWNDINKMAMWSSTNLKDWKCEYLNWPTKDQCLSQTGRPDGVWAPSVVKSKIGKFYMYVSIGREIWVGVADKPAGPWKNARPDNQPLIRHKSWYYVETIDAECFIDDNGDAYLYWGSTDLGYDVEGRCLVAKLNPDMASLAETPHDVTPPHYFEAPYMLKRNGTYYLMYSWGHTWDKTYQVRYATGKTPYGPWQEGMVRPILIGNEWDDRIESTGHNAVLHLNDKYYIVYHRFNTLHTYDISAKLRQVCIDELLFNADGSMQHVVATQKGITPLSKNDSRKNLAFNASIRSSSDLDTVCKAAYAVDENNGTLWIGGTSPKEWLTIDLQKTKAISAIEVYPEFPIYVYQYVIDVSDDGKQWTTVKDGMGNTENGSPFSITKNINARFVRVTMANNKNTPRPGIWEIKIY